MSDKMGSSSYDGGDAGGSYGDYSHGVSDAWIDRKQTAALKNPKTTGARIAKHQKRLDKTNWSAGKKKNWASFKKTARAASNAANPLIVSPLRK